MFKAFQQSIVVDSAGKLAPIQNSPRKPFSDFLIARVKGDEILEYTGSSSNPVEFEAKGEKLDAGTQSSLKSRRLPPEVFWSRYPLDEVTQGVNDSLLGHYPGSTAAMNGLGAMAILIRREKGLLELASMEKPADIFAQIAKAVEYDPSLVDITVAQAPQIARLLYRSNLVNGLNEQLPEFDYPVHREPFRSIYLEGYKRYLENDAKNSVGMQWLAQVGTKTEHSQKLTLMFEDFYRSEAGRQCEVYSIQPDYLRMLTNQGIFLHASDQYAPRALENEKTAALYIQAGYDWRLSPALTSYREADPYEKASQWVQDMIRIFKGEDSNSTEFWGLAGADQCAHGRDILKAIKATDPKGFAKIRERLPQWATLGCLALGVLTIQEVENVPSAGRDNAMAQDLGL
ncbi:hypothetical protein IFT69_14455 [Pseudomonas putida]|nr:hypothetical protein [Pseudomonas putida]